MTADYARRPVSLPPRDVGRVFLLGIGILAMYLPSTVALGLVDAGICSSAWAESEYKALFIATTSSTVFGSVASAAMWIVLACVYLCVTNCRYPLTRLAWFAGLAWLWGAGVVGLGGAVSVLSRGFRQGAHAELGQAWVDGTCVGWVLAWPVATMICSVGIVRGWRSLVRRAEGAGTEGVLVR